jgi:alanine dehydrogenase
VYVERAAARAAASPTSVRGGGRADPRHADEVWQRADMIMKVKEPIAVEYPRMRKDQVIFTYFHFAASRS